MPESNAARDEGEAPSLHPWRALRRKMSARSRTASGRTPARSPIPAGPYLGTLLCMIGVLLFVRTGWVVGEAGLLGALLIVLLSSLVAGSSAALLAAAAGNARSGARVLPDYFIHAFGFEAGGMLAVPALVTQLAFAGLFLYGFAEGWATFFPSHPVVLVAFVAWGIVVLAALIPRRYLPRIQLGAAVVVVGALLSMLAGLYSTSTNGPLFQPVLWGPFDDARFWALFALLFPASAGVLVVLDGRSEAQDPGAPRSQNHVLVVGAAFLLYLLAALWYSAVASPFELRGDVMAGVRNAGSGDMVLAGLLTIALVGALTVLHAASSTVRGMLGRGLLPLPRTLPDRISGDERTRSLGLAAVLVAAVLALGSLNRVAVVTSLFALATFAALHAVVLVDQQLGAVAFRPRTHLPRWMAPAGLGLSALLLLSLNAAFALATLVALGIIYALLVRHPGGDSPGTMRSGLAGLVSDWLGRATVRHPGLASERGWRPDILVAVESRQQLDGTYRFLHLLATPGGSLSILGVRQKRAAAARLRRPTSGLADRDLFAPREETVTPELRPQESEQDLDLTLATAMFRRMDLEATSTVIEAPSLVDGLELSASVLRGTRIRPSLLFGLAHLYDEERLYGVRTVASRNNLGLALLYLETEPGFGYEEAVNVWVSDHGPNWDPEADLGHLNLALLLALQIRRNWKARLRLCTAVRDPREDAQAQEFLHRLAREARLGADVECWTTEGRFMQHLSDAPRADLQIVGLPDEADLSFMRAVVRLTRTSSLFVRTSGRERILA